MPNQRGRPRSPIPKRQITVYLAEDIVDTLDIIFLDPLTRRRQNGIRNALIEQLLREWLRQRQRGFAASATENPNGEQS